MIRCLLEKKDGQWIAVSLEFGLAAQADSEYEARRKLEVMVRSYVYDALVGEDKEHADILLKRRAPLGTFVKFYVAIMASRIRAYGGGQNGSHNSAYREPVPMAPVSCLAE